MHPIGADRQGFHDEDPCRPGCRLALYASALGTASNMFPATYRHRCRSPSHPTAEFCNKICA